MTTEKKTDKPKHPDQCLSIDDIIKKLGISRMTFYRIRKRNDFVKPVMTSPLRWRSKDIDNFFDEKVS